MRVHVNSDVITEGQDVSTNPSVGKTDNSNQTSQSEIVGKPVYYDVRIDTGQDVQTVRLGYNVIIPCGKAYVGAREVRWTHKGKNIASKCRIVSDGSLYLSSFRVVDSGLFQCYIRQEIEFQTTIQAIEPPRFLRPLQTDAGDGIIGQPITANTSDNVRILCRGSGYPKPVVLWTIDGVQLPSSSYSQVTVKKDGSLIIKHAQVSDSGTYMCTISNSAGSLFKKSTVEIHYQLSKPVINRTVRRQTQLEKKKWVAYIGAHKAYVRAKGTLFIKCKASGTPNPSTSWERDGLLIRRSKRIRVRNNGQLRIGGATPADMGTYTCIATNSMGEDRQDIEVVLEGLPKPQLVSLEQEIVNNIISIPEGSIVDVYCSVPASKSDVDMKWLKPSNLNLDNANSKLTSQYLTLEGAENGSGEGRYTCEGHNAVGLSAVSLNVKIVRLAFVTHPKDGVYFNNNLVKNAAVGVQVPTGVKLVLVCSGITNPNIMWRKDGLFVYYSQNTKAFDITLSHKKTVSTSKMTIFATKLFDSGEYTCMMSNGFLTKNSSVAISVGGFPVIRKSEARVIESKAMIRSSAGVDVTSLVGETVILDCPLVNTNSTTIVWMKNYKTVNMGRNVEMMKNGTLVMRNASISDEGEFTCRAENEVGFMEQTGTLRVHRKPTMSLKDLRKVRDRYYEYDAITNTEVKILCNASGYPRPKSVWKKGRRLLSGSGRVKLRRIQETIELVISDFQLDDAGTYICEADNEAGIEQQEVQVYVQAGNEAFNFAYPNLTVATQRLPGFGSRDKRESLRWTEIDSSGRLTNFDAEDSWFEDGPNNEILVNRGQRQKKCTNYVDASLLKLRMSKTKRSVLGNSDDRTIVLDTQLWPHRAAGVISYTERNSVESSFCTGTLINDRHVLTAGHCITDGQKKFYHNIVFYPAANGNSSNPFPYGQYSWTKLYTVKGYHDGAHPGFDYGLIVLNASVGHYITFREAQPTSVVDETVTLNQYPVDRQYNIAKPTMWQSTCPVGSPLIPGSELVYGHTCDSASGASGAGMYLPYVNDSDVAVVFVHTGVGTSTTNRAVAIDQAKFLQLCHWIKNSGGIVENGSPCDVRTKKNDTVQTKNSNRK